MKLTCARCGKRLSRKTARQIHGKPVCGTCLFASSKSPWPPPWERPTREQILAEALSGLKRDLARIFRQTKGEPK